MEIAAIVVGAYAVGNGRQTSATSVWTGVAVVQALYIKLRGREQRFSTRFPLGLNITIVGAVSAPFANAEPQIVQCGPQSAAPTQQAWERSLVHNTRTGAGLSRVPHLALHRGNFALIWHVCVRSTCKIFSPARWDVGGFMQRDVGITAQNAVPLQQGFRN